MRNLIQTQFGTCLHIDCVVIKWLHLCKGHATCIAQLPSPGLGLATAPASDRANWSPGSPAPGCEQGVKRVFKMETFLVSADEMTWEGACTKLTSQVK